MNILTTYCLTIAALLYLLLCLPASAIKAVVIHPATEKHIQKYAEQERFIVHETPQLYEDVTLPMIKSKQFSIQVYKNRHKYPAQYCKNKIIISNRLTADL